jgi:hypothetical protein
VSPEPKHGGGGGLSLQTLLISSVAAVAAAIVVPTFWQRGSLIATAITPIIVAVVSEALNRPAERIKTVAPIVTKRTATGAAVRNRTPSGVGARGEGPEQVPPHDGVSPEDPFGLRAAQRPRSRRRPLKLALATGGLAFLIGAGVVTASELTVFGHAVGKSGSETGLFGGSAHKSSTATPTPTATSTGTATATETATPSATASETATPTETATATETASPTATATPNTLAPTATATPAP